MTEIRVVDVPVTQDLQPFSQYLWQQQIPHRRVTVDDRQWLLVGNKDHARFAFEVFQRWQQNLPMPEVSLPPRSRQVNLRQVLAATPVTYALIALSIVGFLIVSFDSQLGWVQWLTYYQQHTFPQWLHATVPDGQWWRLLTPIFLHFGWLHITFNMLWLFELGRRVERVQGSLTVLGIVMTIGLAGNIAQSWYTKVGIFGGMSGVIYGLLGYSWVWSVLRRDSRLAVPRAVLVFMLGSLVFFMFGFSELLGVGKVANAAHLGGLIMGLIMGALTAWFDQWLRAARR